MYAHSDFGIGQGRAELHTAHLFVTLSFASPLGSLNTMVMGCPSISGLLYPNMVSARCKARANDGEQESTVHPFNTQ